ncbi:unnamed protein product [Clonostachys chloroleuca]|uniref:CCHC-type domain-containing protein n=1 Tax=Clonostachys chloroleuca TaxID=1926264 RepID=A0AA35QG11_9HYPO|nr:unnamed protein product [Clonostachys chloroleuca]
MDAPAPPQGATTTNPDRTTVPVNSRAPPVAPGPMDHISIAVDATTLASIMARVPAPRPAPTCWKCGKPGHFARACPDKEEKSKKAEEKKEKERERKKRKNQKRKEKRKAAKAEEMKKKDEEAEDEGEEGDEMCGGLGASRGKTQGNISEPSVLEDRQSNGRRGR